MKSRKPYLILLAGTTIMTAAAFLFINPKPLVSLTAGQLKSLEGFYNMREDDKFYLQIQVKENKLVLHELWGEGREIEFAPKSDLEFKAVDSNFTLQFSKDKNGAVTQLLALGKDVWIKDTYYKPIERKVISLEAAILKKLEGKYVVDSDHNLVAEVSAGANNLLIKKLWNGQELTFVPESENRFFIKENPVVIIRFARNAAGEVDRLLAFDREIVLLKME